MYIDANGNLVQNGSRSRELLRCDAEAGRGGGGSRIRTVGDLPAQAQDATGGPQQVQNLRSTLLGFYKNPKNIVGALVVIELVMYVVSCWVVTPRQWFSPSSEANWKIGSPDQSMERCALQVGGKYILELRRLVMPIFLHNSIMHIAMNVLTQCTIGMIVLDIFGTARYALIFFFAGLSGNLLSDAFDKRGVGASTACMGLGTAWFAHLWLTWGQMQDETYRWAVKMIVGGYIVISIIWEIIGWNTLDHFGHLGGLIAGFLMAVVVSSGPLMPENLLLRKRVCLLLLALFMAICAVKIFFIGGSQYLDGLSASDRCNILWRQYSQ